MKAIIGIILIILLIGSTVANYKGLKAAQASGQHATRFKIILGVDVILLVLVSIAFIFQFIL
ncbi:hypothetical protein N9R04_00625 [Staphylococcus sp. SQ8-PEA]|uniref:Mid2-like cell wall stress sensor domain protein n=1 Tax=Staphylococcus marylandisciuri TaxID=2981529 RepID=A0ABT2QMP2_9STAP|nr:hypothetical protein [Staphylococcus marylandisciuri]MCU5745224.1 hypothetical protein [Staphylococcus marylandisciuri]